MEFLENILTNDAVQQGIIYLVGIAIAWITRRSFTKKYDLSRIWQAALVAVNQTYEEFVRERKKLHEDGKLTAEDRELARTFALNRLKAILAEEGISLAKYYGPRLATFLINKAVSRSKLAGRVAAAALLPFSEPELPLG